MTNMQRWTDDKLAREHAFAEACKNDSPEAMQWAQEIVYELARRSA